MDLSQTRYVDRVTASVIAARANRVEIDAPIVAAIMRAALLAALGEPAAAGQRVIEAICAIDGKIPPGWAVDAARQQLAPVLTAMADVHSCQVCVVRQLAGLPDRIAQGLRAERIGETLGGAIAHLGMMERAANPQAVAA